MNAFLDSFWRAAAYCLHPRVIVLSLLPLLVTASLAVVLGYFFLANAVASVSAMLDGWVLVQTMLDWLDAMGFTAFRGLLAPLVVVALALPLLIIFSLLLVSLMMTPALVKMVSSRRFPALERKEGASLWHSLSFSVGSTVVAVVALVISVPFWLVPPLVMVLPPLIWGWLTYRVMSFDALAEHATRVEREQLMKNHRWPLLAIGVICGYLGAAPALIWAISATALLLAPILIVASVWLYTLVFAFSALWFAHYLLTALAQMRELAAGPSGSGAVRIDTSIATGKPAGGALDGGAAAPSPRQFPSA
ncbi:EI24 domain-containing protein [soil metagenome]